MGEYEDRLQRALDESPEGGGTGERFQLPDPAVRQEGNVTVYENFRETVDRLDREPALVLRFLQTELGTSAGIDERGRARLTGSFPAERIGDAIEAFVERRVRCPACGRPDTTLVEEGDATLLQCDACGARSSVG